MCRFIHICICIYIYIYIYIYIFVCVCVCLCVYIYTMYILYKWSEVIQNTQSTQISQKQDGRNTYVKS